MIAFHSDMDNTMIFSYKHDIGDAKRCAEIYQGREISFLTEKTYRLLKEMPKEVALIPTTTRTVEQYRRIDLGLGEPQYALVCNGGVLLVDGQEEEGWYQETLELISECREELDRAGRILREDADRSFEVRNIRELFLFTKSERPEISAGKLREKLDMEKMGVFTNGVKVYAVPKRLNKGKAVRRFRERFHPEKVIAAGDSGFDIPMLEEADLGFAPKELGRCCKFGGNIKLMDEIGIFPEKVLEYLAEGRLAVFRKIRGDKDVKTDFNFCRKQKRNNGEDYGAAGGKAD